MRIKLSNMVERIIWVLIVALLFSFTAFESNKYISIFLFIITSFIFLLDLMYNKMTDSLKINLFHLWMLTFAGYCFLSALWANESELALEKGFTIIQILVCVSIIFNHYSKSFNIELLLSSIEYAGYMLTIFAVLYYGVGYIKQTLAYGIRLSSEFANINSVAMACASAIIISIYRNIYNKKKILFKLPLILLSLLIIAASGSRKALVILILGITSLYLFKYASGSFFKIFLKLLIILGALALFFYVILSMQMFEMLNERMEGLIALITGTGNIDHSAWLRQEYTRIGLEQFFKTPFCGIGIANACLLLLQHFGHKTYLHNNYVELLAGGGLIGTSIFYSMYIYIIYKLKSNWSEYRNEKIVVLILLLLQLTMDFGSVSYYSKTTYFNLIIIFLFVKYGKRMVYYNEKN